MVGGVGLYESSLALVAAAIRIGKGAAHVEVAGKLSRNKPRQGKERNGNCVPHVLFFCSLKGKELREIQKSGKGWEILSAARLTLGVMDASLCKPGRIANQFSKAVHVFSCPPLSMSFLLPLFGIAIYKPCARGFSKL